MELQQGQLLSWDSGRDLEPQWRLGSVVLEEPRLRLGSVELEVQ